MSRAFDRSIPSRVDCLHGNLFSMTPGSSMTYAVFYKTTGTNAYGLIRGQDSGGSLCFGMNPYADGNVYWTTNGGSVTGDPYAPATWGITGVVMDNSTNNVYFESWNATTGGSFTRTLRGSLAAFSNTPLIQLSIGVFNPGNHDAIDGLVAIQAIWDRPLAHADFAGFQTSGAAWMAQSPIWALQFGPSDPLLPLDLTGGGGNAFSQTGTSTSADDPPGFTYYGAAPPTSSPANFFQLF